MTHAGEHGELANVHIGVVPSFAGSEHLIRELGTRAAHEFSTVFRTALAGTQLFPHEQARQFATVLEEAGRLGGAGFAGGVTPHLNEVSRNMHRSILEAGALGGTFSAMGNAAMQAFSDVAAEARNLVHDLIEIDDQFEDVERQLALHTKAMGEDLEGLKGVIDSVGLHTSASLHDIASELSRFRGREVNTSGDDFLAMFDGPQRAIRCAMAIRDAVKSLGIEVRAGLHTGECEVRGDDIGGIGVHIGARVSALAGPNDVLVSSTLRDLVIGSGLEFDDRGAHELKGVPGEWRLFAVACP